MLKAAKQTHTHTHTPTRSRQLPHSRPLTSSNYFHPRPPWVNQCVIYLSQSILVATSSKMASSIERILWTVIWLILLIFIGIWLGFLCAFIYIIVSIFTPCIPALDGLKDLALKGLNLPNTCSKNAVNGTTSFNVWKGLIKSTPLSSSPPLPSHLQIHPPKHSAESGQLFRGSQPAAPSLPRHSKLKKEPPVGTNISSKIISLTLHTGVLFNLTLLKLVKQTQWVNE